MVISAASLSFTGAQYASNRDEIKALEEKYQKLEWILDSSCYKVIIKLLKT